MNRMNGERSPSGWRASATNNPLRVLAGCAVIPANGWASRPCRNVELNFHGKMSKKKTGNYQIPFDENGDQLDGAHGWRTTVWVDNHEFVDELTYTGYYGGRSSAYMCFNRLNGKRIVMFLSDFTDAVPYLERGKLRGRFTFTKRGTSFATRMIEPLDTI
jgi:hypothetical protein